ncbi:MAG: IS701 family transposase, partial [Candidatus Solibacter usitatus]|nr:IS701 family transposase [Candidatus Solibacter usitatus]
AGKVTNCQLAVSLAVATKTAQLPIDMQLYLPQSWTQDLDRRRLVKIPDDVPFLTKPQIALEMLTRAHLAGIPLGVVMADAAYGTSSAFRAGIRKLPKHYMAGVNSTLLVHVVDRKKGLLAPQSLAQLRQKLKPNKWRLYRWRLGSKGVMQARFALLQVRVPDDEEDWTVWLVIQQIGEKDQPYKYYLCSLPAQTPRLRLVYLAKARWTTEQMYMECKEELGLDHYEGRSYPGWNHHVSAVLACYALVVACRERAFSPCGQRACQNGAYSGAQAAPSTRLHGDDVRSLWQSAFGLAASVPSLPPRGRLRAHSALASMVGSPPSSTGVTQ